MFSDDIIFFFLFGGSFCTWEGHSFSVMFSLSVHKNYTSVYKNYTMILQNVTIVFSASWFENKIALWDQ